MDSLQTVLALVVLLAPLVAAAGIAASGLTGAGNRGGGRQWAMLGAAISFCAAAAALVRMSASGLNAEGSLGLGVWFVSGPHDPLEIEFAIAMDLPAVALAAVMSLCTFCALAGNRVNVPDGLSERLLYMAASLLLFSTLGIVLSANVGELFVFWQIASLAAYLMSSSASQADPQGRAATKFILTQRVAEFWLLCAVFALAMGYAAQDFDELFQSLRVHGTVHRFALVHFVGLCLIGACLGRCALFPLMGWTERFCAGPALAAVLVEGICLMPSGVLLLIRFLPVLHAASAASAFALVLGGASAFFAAVCAWSETDVRRQAGFACASVFGIVVLGLALPVPTAGAWGVVLTATFLPTSAAVLGWFCAEGEWVGGKSAGWAAGAIALSIALLFSGICGQGGILAAVLAVLARGGPRGHAGLVLALLLAVGAQFFAALAMTRALLAGRLPQEANLVDSRPAVTVPAPIWPMVVLSACGLVVGLTAGALTLAGPRLAGAGAGTKATSLAFAGGSAAATLVGCLPGVAGFLAGWIWPRREPADGRPGAGDGLLLRLGRQRFYADAFLFLLVALPIRGLAQFARFVDWFFIDGFVSGAPASAVDSVRSALEPVQERSVGFYVASAAIGTALLAIVVVWLRY